MALVSDACPATGQAGYHAVTVKVTNADEPGKVTLATDTAGGTPQYLVGATLTATASDGDITNADQDFTVDREGEVTGVVWRWYSDGTEIEGARRTGQHLHPPAGRCRQEHSRRGPLRRYRQHRPGYGGEDHRLSRAGGPCWGQPAHVRPGHGLQVHQRGGRRQERRRPRLRPRATTAPSDTPWPAPTLTNSRLTLRPAR